MRDLLDGKIEHVSMDLIHRLTQGELLNKCKGMEAASEQHTCGSTGGHNRNGMEKIGTPERTRSEQDLADALRSTAAFVERVIV